MVIIPWHLRQVLAGEWILNVLNIYVWRSYQDIKNYAQSVDALIVIILRKKNSAHSFVYTLDFHTHSSFTIIDDDDDILVCVYKEHVSVCNQQKKKSLKKIIKKTIYRDDRNSLKMAFLYSPPSCDTTPNFPLANL